MLDFQCRWVRQRGQFATGSPSVLTASCGSSVSQCLRQSSQCLRQSSQLPVGPVCHSVSVSPHSVSVSPHSFLWVQCVTVSPSVLTASCGSSVSGSPSVLTASCGHSPDLAKSGISECQRWGRTAGCGWGLRTCAP